ncbi:ankyrin repeat domain-containing protein, partial [Halorhodospira sp. 9621]|nr:ankyrin repeat domain-containing protein [Halorhodospira sp. 9621]
RDEYGGTALMHTAAFGEPTMVESLLDHGADASLEVQEGEFTGSTAADLAEENNPAVRNSNVYWRLRREER